MTQPTLPVNGSQTYRLINDRGNKERARSGGGVSCDSYAYLLVSRSPDCGRGMEGGCVRAPSERGGDRLQLAITGAARCTREPAPQLLSTRGFYWPSIHFLYGTHLHTMKAVCTPPFTEDSLSSRHYGMSLSLCCPKGNIFTFIYLHINYI